jgi:hypothetical protein
MDEEIRTLFSYVIQNGHSEIVKLLLDTGKVDLDSKDGKNRTPLEHAVDLASDYGQHVWHREEYRILGGSGIFEVDRRHEEDRRREGYRIIEEYRILEGSRILEVGRRREEDRRRKEDRMRKDVRRREEVRKRDEIVELLLKADANATYDGSQSLLWNAAVNWYTTLVRRLVGRTWTRPIRSP